MRILMLNWRDIDSPWAVGAEVQLQAVAERLVARGHEVLLLASCFPGSAPETEIRRGRGRRLEHIAAEHGVPCRRLGEVGGDVLALSANGCAFSLPVETIRETWRTGLSLLLG